MATSVYVARSLGVDTGILTSGATVGAIVGGDTALDTHDGDTSYILLARDGTLTGETDFEEMTFRWELASGGIPSSVTSITVEGALRRDDTATPETSFGGQFSTDSTFVFAWIQSSLDPDTYIERSTSLDPSLIGWFTSGQPWLISPGVPDPLFRMALRITYLRAVIEGGTPRLRQRLRDDLRARNSASRQRGLRAKGYY